MTICGLHIDDACSPGSVVQRPGLRWPLRRCKRCAPTADNRPTAHQTALKVAA